MGVPVTFQGVSTYPDGQPVCGLFDRPVEMKLMDAGSAGVETAAPTLDLPFNAFRTMPGSGDAVTVEGVVYTVNQPTAVNDGAFLRYELFRTT